MGYVRWNVGGVLVSKGVRDDIIAEGMCFENSGCEVAVVTLKE